MNGTGLRRAQWTQVFTSLSRPDGPGQPLMALTASMVCSLSNFCCSRPTSTLWQLCTFLEVPDAKLRAFQVKQIAGRAGRRGSRWGTEGSVTTLMPTVRLGGVSHTAVKHPPSCSVRWIFSPLRARHSIAMFVGHLCH